MVPAHTRNSLGLFPQRTEFCIWYSITLSCAVLLDWWSCSALRGLLMYNDMGPWWGKRGLVEVKDSFKLCVGREFGVVPGWTK